MYVECEQQMVEQCKTDCKDTGGAIFCDGQFVHAENAQSCADQVEASVSIKIDIAGAISGAADAVGRTASNVGDRTSDTAGCVDDKVCSVRNAGAGHSSSTLFALSPLGFALLWRLRRRSTTAR